jgi:hypothetical protein
MMLLSVYAVLGLMLVTGGLFVALTPRYYQRNLAIVISAFAGIGLVLVFLTPGVYFNYDGYFGDFWTATEAINKTSQGLLSSVDYFSPIGPVYTYVYSLWSLVDSDPSAATVLQAGALWALFVALLAILMLWRHMSGLGLAIVVFSVIGVAVSGRGNGELLQEMPMHYVAPYNRWAWALFMPVALRLALPIRRDFFGDLILGTSIGLLLMLKVTYGAAALGLVLARVVLLPGAWRGVPLLAFGVAAILATIELMTGQVSAHLRDLATTAQLPQSGLRLRKLFSQLGELLIYALAAVIVYFATLQRTNWWSDLRPLLLILLVAGAGCAVLMQNHYAVEAAVYPLLILLALEWNGTLRMTTTAVELRERVLVGGAVAVMLFYPAVDIGMHFGQRVQLALNGPDPAFTGTPYADLRFEPYLTSVEDSLLNTVPDGRAGLIEGLNMLRQAGADVPGAGTVATLAFANPFPMLLGQPSPAGTPIWLHEGRSFSEDTFVPPEILFDGVDYVMSPVTPATLEKIYWETLTSYFSIASEGNYWILRVRNDRDAL